MSLKLFISHSAGDLPVVACLVQMVQEALLLPGESILCTSLDGFRLPEGASTNEQLRQATRDAEAFIGLISPASFASLYVAFELGARWGAGKHLIPVLVSGIDPKVLSGPLAGLNALRFERPAEMLQLVHDLAKMLGIAPQPAAAYMSRIESLIQAKAPLAQVSPLQTPVQPMQLVAPQLIELFVVLERLTDVFFHYSEKPPKATLEQWAEAEDRLKDWLAANRLTTDVSLQDAAEAIAIKLRRFVVEARQMSELLGGDGRPDGGQLGELKREIRQDTRALADMARQT